MFGTFRNLLKTSTKMFPIVSCQAGWLSFNNISILNKTYNIFSLHPPKKHAVKVHQKEKTKFTFIFSNKTQWLMVYGVVRSSLLIYVNFDSSSVQCACSWMGCNRVWRVCFDSQWKRQTEVFSIYRSRCFCEDENHPCVVNHIRVLRRRVSHKI